ncbi:MAG: helix-turn-helix domain-containing protein [Lachnospirales bacterium]
MGELKHKYKYKNIVILSLYTLILLLILILVGFTLSAINNSRREKYISLVELNANNINNSISLSRNSVKTVESSALAKGWLKADTTSEEYYYQYKLIKLLREDINIASGVIYSIGAVKIAGNDVYGITNTSSKSVDTIIDDILKIKRSELPKIMENLRKTGEYTCSYELNSNEYFIRLYYSEYSNNEMVMYTKVPYELLNIKDGYWTLQIKDDLIATSDLEKYQEYLNNVNDINYINISTNVDTVMTYRFIVQKYNLNFLWTLGLIITIISASGYFIIRKISFFLYKPLDNLLYNYEISDRNMVIDEIKLFEESVNKVNILNSNIKNIRKDISVKTKENKYFKLIMGYNEEVDFFDDFFVSLFKFETYTNSEDIYYAQNELQVYGSENEKAIFVRLDNESILFILKVSKYKYAYDIVSTLLYNYLDDFSVTVALTDKYRNFKNLHTAYNAANKIQEYKYYFPEKDIITFKDLQNIVLDDYNFPVAIENKIIYLALKGDDDALNLYDEFIRLNISNTNITNIIFENYVLALINMVNRIFSELKIRPNDLIGYDVSYFDWVNRRNDSNIVFDIRTVLSNVVSKRRDIREKADVDIEGSIIDYVHKNYMLDIMLNDIYSEYEISPQRVSDIFKRNTGMSFKVYLNSYRIERAKEIQEKDVNIKTGDLAEIVGFNSSTSFIRVYKKIVGVSPQEYQRNVKK